MILSIIIDVGTTIKLKISAGSNCIRKICKINEFVTDFNYLIFRKAIGVCIDIIFAILLPVLTE